MVNIQLGLPVVNLQSTTCAKFPVVPNWRSVRCEVLLTMIIEVKYVYFYKLQAILLIVINGYFVYIDFT